MPHAGYVFVEEFLWHAKRVGWTITDGTADDMHTAERMEHPVESVLLVRSDYERTVCSYPHDSRIRDYREIGHEVLA